MRLSLMMCLVFAMTGPVLAQSPAPADSSLEGRYVTACLKEDSAAYCHCEFRSVTQVVHDQKDLEFIVQLEEETAGKPDEETGKIIEKLPQDRQQWLVATQQRLAPLVKACPDYSQHHKD